ncbi:MAG: hypothetical protein EA384_15260 [Spirochaetaceae bacterium]|nr:MAG: hypothetical protein EA384_15260 [Spirochaetaceae bacterium]
MNRKLTLSLDETTIAHAKRYAERHQRSLSEMVESYFRYLTGTKPAKRRRENTRRGIVAELGGMVSVPDSVHVKAEYRRYRAEKTIHG